MLATLRHRNFALLWIGGFISYAGNRMLSTALPFYVYQQTGSTIAIALMTVMTILPAVLLGSFSGVYVDRWPLKKLLVVTNLLQTLATLLLLLARVEGMMGVVYVVGLLQAVLNTFQVPAENVLLPQLVDREHLVSANALNSLNDNLARLIGPPLGGLLLGWLGLETVVLVDSLSFLWAAGLIALLSLPPTRSASREANANNTRQSLTAAWHTFWADWCEGARGIRHDPLVLTLMIVLGATGFAGTMLSPLYPAFADAVLGVGAAGFGTILTAQAVGGIVGGLLLGQWGGRLSATRILAWGNILVGLLLLLQFNLPFYPLVLVVAFLIGPEQVAVNVGLQTLLQERIPVPLQGRIFGAMGMIAALFGLLGASVAGPLGLAAGIVPSLNLAAAITIVVGVVAVIVLPRAMKQPSALVVEVR